MTRRFEIIDHGDPDSAATEAQILKLLERAVEAIKAQGETLDRLIEITTSLAEREKKHGDDGQAGP